MNEIPGNRWSTWSPVWLLVVGAALQPLAAMWAFWGGEWPYTVVLLVVLPNTAIVVLSIAVCWAMMSPRCAPALKPTLIMALVYTLVWVGLVIDGKYRLRAHKAMLKQQPVESPAPLAPSPAE